MQNTAKGINHFPVTDRKKNKFVLEERALEYHVIKLYSNISVTIEDESNIILYCGQI